MQDKDGLGEAMGRQDLALLHFTKCPTEAFVFGAFVSLLPMSPWSALSQQAVIPGDTSPPARRPCTARLCAHSPKVWVPLPHLEGPALDSRGN